MKTTNATMIKKCTGFVPQVLIFPGLHLTDMTPDETEACFHSDQDKRRMQEEFRRDVKYMRRQALRADGGNYNNKDNYGREDEEAVCLRGLEHLHSAAHMEQHKINRDCVVQSVLLAQERERERRTSAAAAGVVEDYGRDEAIARASRAASEWAKGKARERGLSDAAYVRATRRKMKTEETTSVPPPSPRVALPSREGSVVVTKKKNALCNRSSERSSAAAPEGIGAT